VAPSATWYLGGQTELFVDLPQGSTGNAIHFDVAGNLLVADYTGHNILHANRVTREVFVFAHGASMNQPNDLAIAADGTIYASDPNWQAETSQIWRTTPDGLSIRLEAGMGTTNGTEVATGERRLYVNESRQRRVWVYDLSEGQVSNKRLFIRFDDYGLDGMRCDTVGNLYITRIGKGTVAIVSPEG
jgi:gluconolactonase